MELSEHQRRFGEMLRRHRCRVGTGQDKLAGQAGLHRTHLSLLERGKQVPSLAVIHKLAIALGVSMASMMAEVVSEEPSGEEPPPVRPGATAKTGEGDRHEACQSEVSDGALLPRLSASARPGEEHPDATAVLVVSGTEGAPQVPLL